MIFTTYKSGYKFGIWWKLVLQNSVWFGYRGTRTYLKHLPVIMPKIIVTLWTRLLPFSWNYFILLNPARLIISEDSFRDAYTLFILKFSLYFVRCPLLYMSVVASLIEPVFLWIIDNSTHLNEKYLIHYLKKQLTFQSCKHQKFCDL